MLCYACLEETYVIGGRNLVDEVAPDEGDLLKDVALHPRDARSVEDDGEEGDAAEGTRVYAATLNKSVLLACCRQLATNLSLGTIGSVHGANWKELLTIG